MGYFVIIWVIVENIIAPIKLCEAMNVPRDKSANLDAKGRLALPSRYRDHLLKICSGLLVVTIDINYRCLLLYPRKEWEQIERKIESLPSFDTYSGRVKHLLIGHANDLS